MNPTPDKIFRDRLEPLRTPPPDAAWNRITADLKKQRRRKSATRWSVMSLLLLSVTLVALRIARAPESTIPLPQPKIQTPPPAMAHVEPTTPSDPEIASTTPNTPTRDVNNNMTAPLRKDPKTVALHHETKPVVTLVNTSVEENFVSEKSSVFPASTESNTGFVVVQGDVVAPSSSKIIYSANDVERFRRKPKPAPLDTSRSVIQRVFDVAYEIKNENSWLGDFRQMKDEILSRPVNGPARDK